MCGAITFTTEVTNQPVTKVRTLVPWGKPKQTKNKQTTKLVYYVDTSVVFYFSVRHNSVSCLKNSTLKWDWFEKNNQPSKHAY